MNLRGRLLAATVCTAVAGGVVAPASAETLADAIALAYQNNPTLQAQRATQRALDETYVQARAGWRPTLSISGAMTYSEFDTPRAGLGGNVDRNNDGIPDNVRQTRVTTDQSRAQASFSQPLWTGGRVSAAVNAANADVLAGRENLRRIEAQVLASVIQAYADTRRDLETVRIRQENVNVLTRQLQESNARFDVGEVTRTDVAQSQARLSQAQALFQSAVAQLAITRANYATVVGQNPGELAPEPSLAFMLPTDPDDAYKLADQFNPQLRAQQYTEVASRARVAGAHAERMPTVSATATLGFQGPTNPWERELFNRGSTVALNATVPIFNGGLTTSRVRQAVERNNADKITVEGVRRTVLQQVTTFWSQLIAARANISSSEEQVRAAKIAAEGTRQEQQVGLRTTIDVLNAEQELRQAELNQVSSRRDEYVAAANVLAVMGRLEGRNLAPSAPQYDAANNFRKLRITWGWVPWEEAIGVIDQFGTPWPAHKPGEKPVEKPLAPGLEPAPTVVPPPATR